MVKGHAKIELKNVNTGKIRVVEHDNLITNAVAKQIGTATPFVNYDAINSEYLPLYDKGMGGIVLFSNTLEESISNVAMPDESLITGYASNDVNAGTDTKRGSRNLTESQELANGYKYVWDFGTAQANGEIAALSLTHAKTGVNPKSSNIVASRAWCSQTILQYTDDTDAKKVDAQYLINAVDFNWDTSVLTCIITTGTTSISVRKYKLSIGLTPIGVKDTIANISLLSEETITPSSDIEAQTIWMNGKDGYYYGIYISNKSGKIIRINKNNLTLDEAYNMTITLPSKSVYIQRPLNNVSGNSIAEIVDGYLYIKTGIKINLSNPTDITEVDVSNSGNGQSLTYHNDIFHCGTRFMNKDFSFTTRNPDNYNNFFPFNRYGGIEAVFIRDDGVALQIYYDYSNPNRYIRMIIATLYDYLATVNNLDAPVTKTSQEVMKITYTITEV